MVSATVMGYAPDPKKLIKSLKGQSLETSISRLISVLKRRQITGPEPCAIITAHILLQVIANTKWPDVDALLADVSYTGHRLIEANPQEPTIANVTRRVLSVIANEAKEDRIDDAAGAGSGPSAADATARTNATVAHEKAPHPPPPAAPGGGDAPSTPTRPLTQSFSSMSMSSPPRTLFQMFAAAPPSQPDGPPARPQSASRGKNGDEGKMRKLRLEVIDCIQELQEEIATADEMIVGVAESHVVPGDTVMLFRPTATVQKFILRAAAKRKFTAYVVIPPPTSPLLRAGAEEDDSSPAAVFLRNLAAHGVSVVTLRATNVMAYMPRITKCILDARAVSADGGFVSDAGARAVARAAAEHGRTVIVLAGIYKISPLVPYHKQDWVELGSGIGSGPGAVSFADGPLVGNVKVRRAVTEWVDGDFVDFYVTSLGPLAKDHLRPIIADHYSQELSHGR